MALVPLQGKKGEGGLDLPPAAESQIPGPASSCWRPTRGRSGLPFPSDFTIFHLCIPGSLTTTSLFIFCGHSQLPSEENITGVITCHRYLQITEHVCCRWRSYLLIVVPGMLGQPLLELHQTAGPQIPRLIMLVFIGLGCPQSLCWVFEDWSFFSCFSFSEVRTTILNIDAKH